MTEQELMQLVEEAGMFALIGPSSHLLYHEIACLQRFANLVAERERETCVELVSQLRDNINETSLRASAMRDSLEQAEKHIRSRGEKEDKHG